jgi:hypothetical protein
VPLTAQLQVDACCSDINNAAAGSDCSSSSATMLAGPDSTAISKEADTASSNTQAEKQQCLHQVDYGSKQANRAAAVAAAGPVSINSCATGQAVSAHPLLGRSSTTFAPRWRRQLAAAATFFVSGLEHELFMAYATHRVGWRWLTFFSLQGLLLALESGLKRRAAAAGLRLHPAVASLAVLLALGVTADNLFCELLCWTTADACAASWLCQVQLAAW